MAFQNIPNQPGVLRLLRAILRSGRIPHAYLFIGSEGTGREAAAQELATVLLCHDQPAPDDYCGRCESCRAIRSHRHPDYHEVGVPEDRQRIPIASIRDAEEIAYLKSSLGEGRVFVITPAERLSPEAANCFLKTLEEPPEERYFVLITSSLRNIPPTILSRCWPVRFSNLPPEELARRLQAEGLDAGDACWLARRSCGAPGAAQRLRELGLHEFNRDLVERLSELSPEDNFELSDWLAGLARKGAGSASEERRLLEDLLLCAAVFYRDMAVAATPGGSDLFNPEMEGLPLNENAGAPETHLEKAERVMEAVERIAAFTNRRLTLDDLFTSLSPPGEARQ